MTSTPESGPRPRNPAEVREYNDRVWDMVLYKVHPVAIFVLLQILLLTRYTGHPALGGALAAYVFGAQFLGAWCVLQGTLLREMGYLSPAPLVLVVWSLLGLAASLLAGDPLALAPATLRPWAFGYEGFVLVVFVVNLLRWQRLKRRHATELER